MWYLITQIALCLLAAFLIGLLVGWLVWGRRDAVHPAPPAGPRPGPEEAAPLERPASEPLASEPSGSEPVPAGPVGGSEGEPGADDLQRIAGIGPFIEGKLAALGITRYRQIAAFSDADIERVGAAIDFFPDRIRREDWTGQAAALHRELYGEPV